MSCASLCSGAVYDMSVCVYVFVWMCVCCVCVCVCVCVYVHMCGMMGEKESV